jgi:nucleoside-diphosphate-sugar epimerase
MQGTSQSLPIKKKILIVGGCGFIGHNLSLYLKKKGHSPIIVDSLAVNNLNSKDVGNIKNKDLYNAILKDRISLISNLGIELIIQDAKEISIIKDIYEEIKPDILIHLAAVSHANLSNKNPHETFEQSIRSLENTLEFCKEKKIHVIYLSSSMVYGDFCGKEVDEETECNPIGIYGNYKLIGEILVKSYYQIFDLPYTIIRPSALYGERCVSRRVGQIFIENAIQGIDININGNGKEKLDFTYIEDLVDGIEKCCMVEKAKNETFNITFGNGREINELCSILKKNFPETKIIYSDKEEFVPERGTLNNNKAKNLLNFIPRFSLEEGYSRYMRWYINFWKNFNK